MSEIKTHSDMRTFLKEDLFKDLMGPSSPDEVIDEPPTKRYLVGILYPKQTDIDPEEDKDASLISESDEETVDPIALTKTFLPASMGMSFTAQGEILRFNITVSTARYVRIETKDEKEPEQKESKKKYKRRKWKRIYLEKSFEIMIDGRVNKRESLFPSAPNLELNIIARKHGGLYHIAVTLINIFEFSGMRYEIDEYCFFQSKVHLELINPSEVKITSHKRFKEENLDDSVFYELLFLNEKEFAVGHGVSVIWDNNLNPSFLETEYIPFHEVPAVKIEGMIDANLSMKFLAYGEKERVLTELLKVTLAYEDWIKTQQKEVTTLAVELRNIGEDNLKECSNALARLKRGIDELQTNDTAFECFKRCNEVSLIQVSRSIWKKKPVETRETEPPLLEDIDWRPFQIAFVLLNIFSLCHPNSEERKIVDLLWFPTGGGKTEAYLALIAFNVFYRRITKSNGKITPYGTTAIMRYTLRLLTIQQFERAASLICACEYLRRKNEKLGKVPISIGLWVGKSSTPNSLVKTEEIIENIKNSAFYKGSDPRQISSCPWCGMSLDIENYTVVQSPRRLLIRCHNSECDFSNESGLPVYVVDEDIYRVCPTLLIGTVDKFARLPWRSDVGLLFGRNQDNELKHLPPELIIQDEFHLISGPLGSLVGLYESIIEYLCHSPDQFPPKIISSTATIKQAKEQVKNVFNRPVKQFPPPGIIASDSFFSQKADPDEKPGRIYMGLNAPGISGKTLLLRVYANLLLGVQKPRCNPDYRDPYWTLVGYFNSMRELGAARTLVDDDIQARYKLIHRRFFNERLQMELDDKVREEETDETKELIEEIKSKLWKTFPWRNILAKELTGRVPATEIPETLKNLEISYNPDSPASTIPVLLATNMISVGVDVNRLGLMVVTGQPKGTSEYIQSTSRVGRKFPGLIVTMYNWSRPRDLSHYERFQSYHSALYKYVETSSVTPFSSRAMDRGLHAVFISLIRHTLPNMSNEEATQIFSEISASDLVSIKNYLLNRIAEVDGMKSRRDAEELIEKVELNWRGFSSTSENLTYGRKYDPKHAMEPHLLHSAEDSHANCPSCTPTLNSLRNIEAELGLYRIRKRE